MSTFGRSVSSRDRKILWSSAAGGCSCSDFATWRQAQDYFEFYYPHYGDIARLDQDNDLIACETLPGAP